MLALSWAKLLLKSHLFHWILFFKIVETILKILLMNWTNFFASNFRLGSSHIISFGMRCFSPGLSPQVWNSRGGIRHLWFILDLLKILLPRSFEETARNSSSHALSASSVNSLAQIPMSKSQRCVRRSFFTHGTIEVAGNWSPCGSLMLMSDRFQLCFKKLCDCLSVSCFKKLLRIFPSLKLCVSCRYTNSFWTIREGDWSMIWF